MTWYECKNIDTEDWQNVPDEEKRKEENVQRAHVKNRQRVDFTNDVCSKWCDGVRM